MKKPRRKTNRTYKTCICSVTAVEDQVNRLAAKGWVLSQLLLVAEDSVLLVCKLDSLGDMTQLLQMRLQKYLDAYTEMFEVLSNTQRKISEVQTSLISNMK